MIATLTLAAVSCDTGGLGGKGPGATGWRGWVPVAKAASVTADGGWKGGKGQKTSRYAMYSFKMRSSSLEVQREINAQIRLMNQRLERQIMEQKRVLIEDHLMDEAHRADRECLRQEFEARKRRDPKWIEKQLYKEAIAADRLLMVQEFEAREVARGVDLEELYGREECLVEKNHACFMTAPLKITVARGGPIAKKHKRIHFKMSGHKRWACDRLGLLPN